MGQPSPSALNAKSPLALNAEAPSFKPTSPMRKSALRADAPIFEPCPSPVRQSRPATGVDSPASASRLSPGAREALKAELRKLATHASQDSYVGSELRECDARGFMAAGALLWCKEADGVEGVALLMAEERRRPGGPTQLNFLGGKRDAVNESAGATAAREIGEETGELMSEATRAAIRAAKGPVVWDRQGKYVTFLVEVRDGADATVARRLRERGGPPDPGDESLISVEWVAVADAVRDEWCRRRVARHHLHALRLLWPHLRALQEAAEEAHGGAKGGEGGGRGDGSTAGGPCCASEAPLEGASTRAGTSSASTSTTSVEGGRPDDLAEVMGRVSLAS